MRTVWKTSIDIFNVSGDKLEVALPEGAFPVHTQVQDQSVCVWFEVDPEAEKEMREFMLVGTGHDVPDRARYVGTGLYGPLVLHVYEVETGK